MLKVTNEELKRLEMKNATNKEWDTERKNDTQRERNWERERERKRERKGQLFYYMYKQNPCTWLKRSVSGCIKDKAPGGRSRCLPLDELTMVETEAFIETVSVERIGRDQTRTTTTMTLLIYLMPSNFTHRDQ